MTTSTDKPITQIPAEDIAQWDGETIVQVISNLNTALFEVASVLRTIEVVVEYALEEGCETIEPIVMLMQGIRGKGSPLTELGLGALDDPKINEYVHANLDEAKVTADAVTYLVENGILTEEEVRDLIANY